MKNETDQNVINKKTNKWKYILVTVFLLLLITAALVFIYFTQETISDPTSEALIRWAAAQRLNKEPNDLTDEDFSKIKVLHFAELKLSPRGLPGVDYMLRELSEITLLKKFTNLEKLNFQNIRVKKNIPQWMRFLAKFGIINLDNKFKIDLNPLAKLSKLQVLDLKGCPIKSLRPLSKLTNLRMLDISETPVSDIEPLKNLTNLKQVLMLGCKNITDKQVEDLQKALPKLNIEFIQIMPNSAYWFKSHIVNMWELNDFLPEAETINPYEKKQEIQNAPDLDII